MVDPQLIKEHFLFITYCVAMITSIAYISLKLNQWKLMPTNINENTVPGILKMYLDQYTLNKYKLNQLEYKIRKNWFIKYL